MAAAVCGVYDLYFYKVYDIHVVRCVVAVLVLYI